MAPRPGDYDFRREAFDVLAASSRDIEDERRQQSELERIRAEIMDIARDVASLRRRRSGSPANDAMPDRSRPNMRHDRPVREPQNSPAQAPRIRPWESPEQRQRISGSRRHQLVERAHWHARSASVDPAILAAPARPQWPLLAIGHDVLQHEPVKATTPKAALKPKNPAKPRGLSLAAKAALFTALILAGTAVITVALRGELPRLAHELRKASRLFADVPSFATEASVPKPVQSQLDSAADQTSALYPFEKPDTYGVYAVDEGHLTALEPLPIRVPDARVAISSAIAKPAPAPVMHGTPLFVVYHRELATNVPESATVRVFAQVMQASTFVGGKPKPIQVQDTWAVRGGAIDLRIAPVAANKEMILIRPADPNFTLSPGRYVLMFKNQAYDFSVAGTVSDNAHCLERSDLPDGPVYSECRELPAPAAKS